MKTKVVTLGAAALIFILAGIYIVFFVGSAIFYDFSFKLPFTKSTNASQGLVQGTTVQGTTITNPNVPGNMKSHTSDLGLTINYPKSWGILTCSNSYNFELDPTNGTDMLNMMCNDAMKPISVIISNGMDGCSGDVVRIGNIDVLKSQTTTQNYTTYQWCTLTQPSLIISNRTSTTTTYAATTTNYSSDIENIIKSLQFNVR